jgi:23S rRNA pseudouridine2605 synthase
MKKKIIKKEQTASQMSLSKFIALGGVGSRRKATEIIKKGEVTVNNKIIKEPGYKLKEDDVVTVNGKLIKPEEKVYILLNKPKDYITTVFDEKGRKTVMQLIDIAQNIRLYPVGRLDRATTGLLVLTNDGDLALKLSHPRYEISKTYHVVLDHALKQNDLKQIAQDGVQLEDGLVTIDSLYYVAGEQKNHVIIELHSGKNRVVRRLFEAMGYQVKKLDRVQYAGLTKKNLRSGAWRMLSKQEVNQLKNLSAKK